MKNLNLFIVAIVAICCFGSCTTQKFSIHEKESKETKAVTLFNNKLETVKVELSPKKDNLQKEENEKINLDIDLKWQESENSISFDFKNQTDSAVVYFFEMNTSNYAGLKGKLGDLLTTKQIKDNPILTSILFKDTTENIYKDSYKAIKKGDDKYTYTKEFKKKINVGDTIVAYITLYVATEKPKEKLCYEAKTIELEITFAKRDDCENNYSGLSDYYEKLNNDSTHNQIGQKIKQLNELVAKFNKQNDSYKCTNCKKESDDCAKLKREIETLIKNVEDRIDDSYLSSDAKNCIDSYESKTGNKIRSRKNAETQKLSDHRTDLNKIRFNFCDEWNRKTAELKVTLEDAKNALIELDKKVINKVILKSDGQVEYDRISAKTDEIYNKYIKCVQSKCSNEYNEYRRACNLFNK